MMKPIKSDLDSFFSPAELAKLREIANEEWLIPKWLKTMDEYSEVFKKMLKKITDLEKKMKILTIRINRWEMKLNE